MVATGRFGLIPPGRVIYVLAGVNWHFIDPSKPEESEHCAEETHYQKLPD